LKKGTLTTNSLDMFLLLKW